MTARLVLASASEARQRLLRQAGVAVETGPAKIDEPAVRAALALEGAGPRDVADALAEQKARKISGREPEAFVLGCDQVLELDGEVLAKPDTPDELRSQLGRMNGRAHRLLSACVICNGGEPQWRHVGVARLHMRQCSAQYLDAYIERNWSGVRHGVGGYRIEEEGVRLFHRIEGDLFTVMGLPLLELLGWLTLRELIPG